MRTEWQAHLDDLLKEYRRRRDGLRRFQETVTSMSAEATAAEEMITVRVGAQGRLVGLELDPRVYRRLSPSELAEAILAAAAEATNRVGEQVRSALEPMLPDTANYDVTVRDGVDLSRALPDPPEDFDAVRARYGFREK